MPPIEPIQILKCLNYFLDDNGGILSSGEVKRMTMLMTRYSTKLVSKCIYLQILKCTKRELLSEVMGAGGWSLVNTWLHDANIAMNWPLVEEILELLNLCPVDIEHLNFISVPKLVEDLSKVGNEEQPNMLNNEGVEQLQHISSLIPTHSAATICKTLASIQLSNQSVVRRSARIRRPTETVIPKTPKYLECSQLPSQPVERRSVRSRRQSVNVTPTTYKSFRHTQLSSHSMLRRSARIKKQSASATPGYYRNLTRRN